MKKQKFTDFYTAWWWLYYHPLFLDYEIIGKYYTEKSFPCDKENLGELFSRMNDCIDISPHLVNPKTKRIDDDKSKNTHVDIWIETGYKWKDSFVGNTGKEAWVFYHDWKLDCGGDTYEEAIIELANRVWKRYGTGKKFMNEKLKELGVKLKEIK